jgi:phage nucleotide-binding protein
MNILSTKDIAKDEKFRLMIYGQSGIGKTKLISTIPDKVLVLNTDKGMQTLSKSDVDYVSANTWKEVLEFLNYIKTEEAQKKYKWIVFDSISAAMDLLYMELSEVKKLGGFDLWREYGAFVMKFMRFLRDQSVFHTLSIYEAIDKEDDSGIPTKGFGVQGQIGARIPNFYDEVFALRINKSGERVLQTTSSPGWIAKDRSQLLEANEKADLNIIMKKIIGG